MMCSLGLYRLFLLSFVCSFSYPTPTNSQSSTVSNMEQPSVSTDKTSEYPFSFTDVTTSTTTPATEATALDLTTSSGSETATTDVSTETTESNATSIDDATTTATVGPITALNDCLCDITPDFCDIGCCCDIEDCGIVDLNSVFTGCEQGESAGMCIERWLVFRANVDPGLLTITDSLFCVQRGDEKSAAQQTLPALSEQLVPPLYSPHFSMQEPVSVSLPTMDFYRVDDIVLTYYNTTSIQSMLRQPSRGAASSSCVDRNPAKFLRTQSLSCSRFVGPLSCQLDVGLSASSYVTGLSVLRVPSPPKLDMSKLMIPVTPLSEWPEPSQLNGLCSDVVSKVEYVIEYTGQGEITMATVNITLANTSLDTLLWQQHTVRFQLTTPSPSPAPTSSVGLKVGTPVIGWFGEEAQPMTVLGVSPGGECSADPLRRASILFRLNTISGCTFSSDSRDCAALTAELYTILRGVASADLVAMTSGSEPDWSRVITQDCSSLPVEGSCEAGCLLPLALSVQILWAQRGHLALPQDHILGAKYVYSCQMVKCPLSSPIAVTTEVVFSDATVYPEAPWGKPQPEWKFPFAFFTQGAGEQDGI